MILLLLVALAQPVDDLDAKVRDLLSQEDSLAEGLATLDQRIVELTESQASNQAIVDGAAEKLATLDHQIDVLKVRMKTQRARLVRRLRARQQLEATAWLQILLTSTSPEELVRRRHYLERILGADVALLDTMKGDRAMLDLTRRQRIDAEKAARAAAHTIERERAVLESDRALRTELIRRLRGQRRTMRRMRRAQRDARAGIEPLFAERSNLGGGGIEGDIDAEYGLLPRPTPGPVVRRYESGHNGVVIRAPRGAPVRAIYSGRLISVGWREGFGTTVIIDHGGGFHSLYAHLGRTDRPQDALIAQGEILGAVGESGSLDGPRLYFEFRAQGQPEDPQLWLRR